MHDRRRDPPPPPRFIMPRLRGPGWRGHAARRGCLWLVVLVVGSAVPPQAAAYSNMPLMDVEALPPNSFVNFSNGDQLAEYARSQALPADANVTRPCGCECLPSWSHMKLPDYDSAPGKPCPKVSQLALSAVLRPTFPKLRLWENKCAAACCDLQDARLLPQCLILVHLQATSRRFERM